MSRYDIDNVCRRTIKARRCPQCGVSLDEVPFDPDCPHGLNPRLHALKKSRLMREAKERNAENEMRAELAAEQDAEFWRDYMHGKDW